MNTQVTEQNTKRDIYDDTFAFYSLGLTSSFFEEEGRVGLVKDYQGEVNHLFENQEPLTDETTFSVAVTDEHCVNVSVGEMVSILETEIDNIAGVFRNLIEDIPQKCIDRVKTVLKSCVDVHEAIYCVSELNQEELKLLPSVKVEMDFEFSPTDDTGKTQIGMVTVKMSVSNDDDFSDDENEFTILDASVELFCSNTKETFIPFDLED